MIQKYNGNAKIVNVSFQRNATQSFYHFMTKNNFPGIHHISDVHHSFKFEGYSLEQIKKEIEKYESRYVHFSDAPYFVMYEHFDKKYPGSKFILVKRDPIDWVTSIQKLYNLMPVDPASIACYKEYGLYLTFKKEGTEKVDDQKLIDMYNKHNNAVEEYFKNKDNLLVLEMNDPNKKDKIESFLNVNLNGDFQKIDNYLKWV